MLDNFSGNDLVERKHTAPRCELSSGFPILGISLENLGGCGACCGGHIHTVHPLRTIQSIDLWSDF